MKTALRPLPLIAVAASFQAISPPVLAQASHYGLREDEPPVGSSIRRYRVEGGGIPFDKRYDEMTAEEKAAVKALYEKIEPGDEPPFPANGMLSIHDAVSRAQKKLAVTGDLTVVATVSPSGDVLQVKAIGSPSEPMVKFVAAIL